MKENTTLKEIRNMQLERTQDDVIAHVQIKGSPDGRAQIYIDGKPVKGLIEYKIEHNSSDKRAPVLTMQVYCTLEMDSGAIPLLPEPWSWFYEPKYPNFVDGHQFAKKSFPDPGTK